MYPELEQLSKSEKVVEVSELPQALGKEVQAILKKLNYYSGEVDGLIGAKTIKAFQDFKLVEKLGYPNKLGESTAKRLLELDAKLVTSQKLNLSTNDLASRIISRMQALEMCITSKPDEINIVYLEGVDKDGTPNSDKLDSFNDRRIVIKFLDNKPKIIGNWLATTEPGAHYTYKPMNPGGAARIQIDKQFKSWAIGMHGSGWARHESLVQVRPITVCRDFNKDGFRTGDKLDTGLFGVNQHSAFDSGLIGRWSAGCLVGQSHDGHREFMNVVRGDRRCREDASYVFYTAVLDGGKV